MRISAQPLQKETANALPNGRSLNTKVWYSLLFSGCLLPQTIRKSKLIELARENDLSYLDFLKWARLQIQFCDYFRGLAVVGQFRVPTINQVKAGGVTEIRNIGSFV